MCVALIGMGATPKETLPSENNTQLIFGKPQEYQKVLDDYTKWYNNLCKSDFYANFSVQDGQKKVYFKNFSDFEKDVFYLTQFYEITKDTTIIFHIWQRSEFLLSPDVTKKYITEEQLDKYVWQMAILRIVIANKVEKETKRILEKHKNINQKERDFLVRGIHRFHLREGLAN